MNRLVKLVWILGQGVFLPLVLLFDDLRTSGQYWQAVGAFALLEVLYLGDAWLFLKLFYKEKHYGETIRK